MESSTSPFSPVRLQIDLLIDSMVSVTSNHTLPTGVRDTYLAIVAEHDLTVSQNIGQILRCHSVLHDSLGLEMSRFRR